MARKTWLLPERMTLYILFETYDFDPFSRVWFPIFTALHGTDRTHTVVSEDWRFREGHDRSKMWKQKIEKPMSDYSAEELRVYQQTKADVDAAAARLSIAIPPGNQAVQNAPPATPAAPATLPTPTMPVASPSSVAPTPTPTNPLPVPALVASFLNSIPSTSVYRPAAGSSTSKTEQTEAAVSHSDKGKGKAAVNKRAVQSSLADETQESEPLSRPVKKSKEKGKMTTADDNQPTQEGAFESHGDDAVVPAASLENKSFDRFVAKLNAWPLLPVVHTSKVDYSGTVPTVNLRAANLQLMAPSDIFLQGSVPYAGGINRVTFCDQMTGDSAELDVQFCSSCMACGTSSSAAPQHTSAQPGQVIPMVHNDDIIMLAVQGTTFSPRTQAQPRTLVHSNDNVQMHVYFTGGKKVLVEVAI